MPFGRTFEQFTVGDNYRHWPGKTITAYDNHVLEKTRSRSKPDRGVIYVETVGYKQTGQVVCIFRRRVMVPTEAYLASRGGRTPGRPAPVPNRHWKPPADVAP